MGKLVDFAKERQPLARPKPPEPGELVIFPGVRYERRPPDKPDRPGKVGKKSR